MFIEEQLSEWITTEKDVSIAFIGLNISYILDRDPVDFLVFKPGTSCLYFPALPFSLDT